MSARSRFALALLSLALLVGGAWLAFPAWGWRGVVGAVLIVWGNNASQEVARLGRESASDRILDEMLTRAKDRRAA
jgi:hypothetical protein